MAKKLFTFIGIAYGFSWAVWIIPIICAKGNYSLDESVIPYILIGSFGPALSAISLTYIKDKTAGLKSLFKKYLVLKHKLSIYLATLFILPLVTMAISFVLGFDTVNPEKSGLTYLTMAIAPLNGFISIFAGIGPLGEELGWRGYLQPLLQRYKNDWGISFIVGLIWSFWHTPIFLFPEFRNGISFSQMFVFYPISTILLSFCMTKIWKWTKGSVFIAMWFHGLVNSLFGLVIENFDYGDLDSLIVYNIVIVILLISAAIYWIIDKFRYKDQSL